VACFDIGMCLHDRSESHRAVTNNSEVFPGSSNVCLYWIWSAHGLRFQLEAETRKAESATVLRNSTQNRHGENSHPQSIDSTCDICVFNVGLSQQFLEEITFLGLWAVSGSREHFFYSRLQ
jgi:hypothetical protein